MEIIMADDTVTPINLVGRKIVPILVKDDGSAMAESMDIVAYLDNLGDSPLLTGQLNQAITDWVTTLRVFLKNLTYPRFARAEFHELSTPSARKSYCQKETLAIGDLDEKFDLTELWVPQLNDSLNNLDNLLVSTDACNGELSEDDVQLFVFLRNASIVKGAIWPVRVELYLRKFSERTGVPLFFDMAM